MRPCADLSPTWALVFIYDATSHLSEAHTRSRSGSLASVLAALLCGVFVLEGDARATPSVSLVGGTREELTVTVGTAKTKYFRVVGEERLIAVAEGPVTLAVHFRALGSATGRGILRITRDNGPFSDNRYTLEHDESASTEIPGKTQNGAASVERVIQVQVPEGIHRFAFGGAKGPALAIHIYKAATVDPTLAAAAEKNVWLVASDSGVHEHSAAPAAPTNVPAATPAPAPVGLQALMASGGSDKLVKGDLAFSQKSTASDPVRVVVAARGGVAFPMVQPAHAVGVRGGLSLEGRWLPSPAELEVGVDVTRVWGIYVDTEYQEVLHTQHAPITTEFGPVPAVAGTFLRMVPLSVGVTALVPCCAPVGLRFRLGAAGAWLDDRLAFSSPNAITVDDAPARGYAYGAEGGISFDIAAGPGHISIEGRYLLLRSKLPVHGSYLGQSFTSSPSDLDQSQLLAGYRLEL
jgi:hypothetical protein